MITCEIMKDLLPAYVAGECSAETRKAVEEHLATCASCAKSLWTMTETATTVVITSEKGTDDPGLTVISSVENKPDDTEEEGNTAEEGDEPAVPHKPGKEKTFRSVFKKNLRMTLILLLCLILIIPLAGLGILSYNEKRGEGYAFSNLEGLRDVDTFMKCLQKGDYAGAVEFFDIGSMYWQWMPQEEEPGFFISEYRLVEIGGANYYIPIGSSLLTSTREAEPYNEPGTDATFWAQVIIDDVESWHESPIPEQAFEDAARIAAKTLGEDVRSVDILSEEPDGPYTYIRYYAQDGAVYYRSTVNGRLSEVEWMNAALIPESLLPVYIKEHNQEIDERNKKSKAYRDLGVDGYTELVKDKYIADWTELETYGMKMKSYSIGKPYRRIEMQDSFIGPIENEQIIEEHWLVDVEVLLSIDHDGNDETAPIEYERVFAFVMDGEYLNASGSVFMHSTAVYGEELVMSAVYYDHLISPDPYNLEMEINGYYRNEYYIREVYY